MQKNDDNSRPLTTATAMSESMVVSNEDRLLELRSVRYRTLLHQVVGLRQQMGQLAERFQVMEAHMKWQKAEEDTWLLWAVRTHGIAWVCQVRCWTEPYVQQKLANIAWDWTTSGQYDIQQACLRANMSVQAVLTHRQQSSRKRQTEHAPCA